ncbi:MAG: LamG domain-containing protein, partial [Akkermansiaceae bacterium]
MKTPSLFLALTTCVLLNANASTVAHYHLDGNYLDSGGDNLHGSGTSNLSFTTSTAPSSDAGTHALNARNDYDFAAVTHNDSFNLNTFTLEAMVRVPVAYTNQSPTIGFTSQYVAHKLRSTSTGSFLSSYGMSINQLSGVVNGTAAFTTGGVGLSSTTAINDNEWHHIALTFDGSSLRLYVDHVIANQVNNITGTVRTGVAPFLIGAGNFGTPAGNGAFRRNFQGDIDEVRLSDVALNSSDFLTVPEPSSSLLLGLASVLI